MRVVFLLVLVLFISIFTGIHYYIGLRGWQAFGGLGIISARFYWVSVWFLAFSYLLSQLMHRFLPLPITHALNRIGAYWLGAMVYFTLLIVTLDIIGLANRGLGRPLLLQSDSATSLLVGIVVVVLVLGIVLGGALNARRPVVRNYTVEIGKQVDGLGSLNVVMFADLHLGLIINEKRLQRIVEEVNILDPDLVFIVGDIVDEKLTLIQQQNFGEQLAKIQARWGRYAVLGNHDYMGGRDTEVAKWCASYGINVLRDELVLVAESIYVAGRKDASAHRFGAEQRLPVSEFLDGIDSDAPLILLDHQPVGLDEVRDQGVDLMLAGHTHRGQLFPFGYITRKIFEVDWGYRLIGGLHIIVTSGVGTWGPPLRVGNRSEIIQIQIDLLGDYV